MCSFVFLFIPNVVIWVTKGMGKRHDRGYIFSRPSDSYEWKKNWEWRIVKLVGRPLGYDPTRHTYDNG